MILLRLMMRASRDIPKPGKDAFEAANEAGLQICLSFSRFQHLIDLSMVLQKLFHGVEKLLQWLASESVCNHHPRFPVNTKVS